ncbi:MAG TPA: trypsin-like peptidase domain-containing protein [Pirellulales bacterium]
MRFVALLVAAVLGWHLTTAPAAAQDSYSQIAESTFPKIVKIYGAGGFRGLEAYQSGFLISPEGHILTVWSYVLDTEFITVVLDDGRRFEQAKLLGADPRLEVAVLKIEAENLPCFKLEEAAKGDAGTRVLAFSNLYGVAQGNEAASVQHGIISARTRLEARRGVFDTPYRGDVYILDAVTNNPGAPGGALTTRRGELLGMLGKELKNSLNNTWLNYSVPVEQLKGSVDKILRGESLPPASQSESEKPAFAYSTQLLGLTLVPDVIERTPPFIDEVRSGSPAAGSGLRPDDLVLFVNGRLVQSCKTLVSELERIDRAETLNITVIRDQELIEVEMSLPVGQGENRP